ncbi:hypothetical protein QL285_037669 [Trifolium repens]|nr:hypothetical protein QL285_037669 [Trifolium repens]
MKVADTIIKPLNALYSLSANTSNLPLITQPTKSDTINNQLLPNQALVFSSQPSTQTPPKHLPTNHKNTCGSHKMNLPTRNKNLTQPNLNVDQPRPDKKTEVFIPIINPTHNLLPKNLDQQVDQNMENPREKKRRREEGNSTNKDTIEASEHFLTLSGPMKILSWNCRVLSIPSAIPNLRNIVQGHKPYILFLLETLSKSQTMERIRVNLKFNSCLSVDVEGRRGGLSVMWRDNIKCRVLNYSRNFINLVVEDKKEEWRLTCYYGYPERGRMRQA